MGLRIYNTLTGKKEEFVPFREGEVGMYVCGVTVYDDCHIGHARANVVFDIIYRYLIYAGYRVKYVRNFTDIDDKIIKRANELNMSCNELAERYINAFYRDMNPLNILPPDFEPKATDNISEMIKIIRTLVDKGFAYETNSGVYYSVKKFKEYGKLSKKNIDDLISGARVEVDEEKEDPLDFALWKKAKPGEPFWKSPWGEGRPGWHIECSAMSRRYIGNVIDIHGGGKDLVFPHHENEIAQSEAANEGTFARYWIHNGFVNINKEKMSKSLGNFFTVKEVLTKYHPEVLRLFFILNHYRSPIDFSDRNLEDAKAALERLYQTLQKGEECISKVELPLEDKITEKDKIFYESFKKVEVNFDEAMNDDFNTASALAHIFDLSRRINKYIDSADEKLTSFGNSILLTAVETLKKLSSILGLLNEEPENFFKNIKEAFIEKSDVSTDEIEALIKERTDARNNKRYAYADSIRQKLENMGIILEDTPKGTIWKVKE